MKNVEDMIQRHLVRWFELQHPQEAQWLHHSPNGGLRSKATAGRLKAAGTRRGFPDLIYPRARGDWAGLVVELKAPKGRPTPEQLAWLDLFATEGWMAVLCEGLESARSTVMAYMALPLAVRHYRPHMIVKDIPITRAREGAK